MRTILSILLLCVSFRTDCFDDGAAIRMLEEFYVAYLTEQVNSDLSDESICRTEQIRKKYVTADLSDKLYNREMLEYDPFVNAQDYFDDWLETLKVTATNHADHIFTVTLERYNTFIPTDARVEITLSVVKENGKYKIGDIIPQKNRTRQASEPENTDEFTGSNDSVNRGRYIYNNGRIVIEILENDRYRIFEQGELADSGTYNVSGDDNDLYIEMKDISAMYYNDTLVIQNSGNAMNPFRHFKSADDKYIYLINRNE